MCIFYERFSLICIFRDLIELICLIMLLFMICLGEVLWVFIFCCDLINMNLVLDEFRVNLFVVSYVLILDRL